MLQRTKLCQQLFSLHVELQILFFKHSWGFLLNLNSDSPMTFLTLSKFIVFVNKVQNSIVFANAWNNQMKFQHVEKILYSKFFLVFTK